MKYVGIDLHKKSITVCVIDQGEMRKGRRFECAQPEKIVEFFKSLGEFEAVMEATAGYPWLYKLLNPLARRVVLAHPRKLRIIAESTRKSDAIDARVLAEFLALRMIPESYRPTPRQHAHRRLVRHRHHVQGRITSQRTKIRQIVSDYNADRRDLFTVKGREYLATVPLKSADRFVVDQLLEMFDQYREQLAAVDKQIAAFAKTAPAAEAEARTIIHSIIGVGTVITEVALSEVADFDRFGSQKKVVAYSGLAPGYRSSAGKRYDLHIEKTGSPLLRWALVEGAWQMVQRSNRWRTIFENLARRTGRKKAIVAIARRLLTLMMALVKSGRPYDPAHPIPSGKASQAFALDAAHRPFPGPNESARAATSGSPVIECRRDDNYCHTDVTEE